MHNHAGWLVLMAAGGVFGAVYHRFRYAIADHRSAKNRIRGARRELRRASAWAAGFLLLAVFVVHVLV